MPAFTLISLLNPVSFSAPASPACSCSAPATRVKVIESFSSRDGLWLRADWASACCDAHQEKGVAFLGSRKELEFLHRSHLAELGAVRQEYRRLVRRNEAAALSRDGFILRLSGRKGQLVELPDGSLQCRMYDGATHTPCCWAAGTQFICGRSTESQAWDHSPGCRHLARGAA